ncbi:MAG: NAD-dependent deacylase [Boseongicola sp.]|nr:NAD-dependent deacylase [Boseongicola sp.]
MDRNPGKIVVLTGAGVSAESGLGTFRDKGGVWTRYDLNEVATPEGFRRDPTKVHDFYNARRKNAAGAKPNGAHAALARLARDYPGEVVIITQNVDSLHEAAGTAAIHMHGRLDRASCTSCGAGWDAPMEMHAADACPECSEPATRPDVVWFGEVPHALDEIAGHLEAAVVFAAIGTSGQVHPAAGFVSEARRAGAHTIEINLAESDISALFHERIEGPATQCVPLWVERLLNA